MKKYNICKKVVVCLLLTSLSLLSLTACGNKTGNESTDTYSNEGYENSSNIKVMVVGEEDVYMDEALVYVFQNLYLRGDSSEGWTDNHSIAVKNEVLSSIRESKILYKVAKDNDFSLDDSDYETVNTTSANFENTFGQELLDKYGISHETVYRVFEEQALVLKFETYFKNDMGKKINDDLDEQYKDFRFNSIYYMQFPTVEKNENDEPKVDENGKYVTLNDEEKAKVKEQAESALEELRAGGVYTEVAEKYGITQYCTETYGYIGGYSDELNKALDKLNDGECTDIMEGELGYSIVYVITADDATLKKNYVYMLAKEATESQYEILRNNWLSTVEIDPEADMEGTAWDDLQIKPIIQDMENMS